MPVNPADSPILGTLYGSDAMRAVFDESAYFQRMLDVEAALARVQGRMGVIPADAAEAIIAAEQAAINKKKSDAEPAPPVTEEPGVAFGSPAIDDIAGDGIVRPPSDESDDSRLRPVRRREVAGRSR